MFLSTGLSGNAAEGSAEEAVRRVLAGDRQAFSEIVEAVGTPIMSMSRRLTGCRETAGDIVQETFIKIFNNLDKYDQTKPFKPWAMTIAANCIRDWGRSRKRQNVLPLEPELVDAGIGGAAPPWKRDLSEGPGACDPVSEEVSARDTGERLEKALAAMDPEEAMLISLKHFSGMSCAEIAGAMGLTEVTVRVRLHRARGRLKSLFGSED